MTSRGAHVDSLNSSMQAGEAAPRNLKRKLENDFNAPRPLSKAPSQACVARVPGLMFSRICSQEADELEEILDSEAATTTQAAIRSLAQVSIKYRNRIQTRYIGAPGGSPSWKQRCLQGGELVASGIIT